MKGKALPGLLLDYGLVVVLLALVVSFSAATVGDQSPTGAAAGEQVAAAIRQQIGSKARVLIAARDQPEEALFAETLAREVENHSGSVVATIKGEPGDAREVLRKLALGGGAVDVVAGTRTTAGWPVFAELGKDFPSLGQPRIFRPYAYRWPNFLRPENLLKLANQFAVLAVVALGVTFVVIAGGIDLSVGGLMALSAVLAAHFMRASGGGGAATTASLTSACLAAVLLCGLLGAGSGAAITFCGVPSYLVTLVMMLVSGGLADLLTREWAIDGAVESFAWLGRADIFHVPNALPLVCVLYALAWLLMARTKVGRYLSASGGNAEAAYLSGVPVKRVAFFAYASSGLLAGFGGVLGASQFENGSPASSGLDEFEVLAAVLLGGTSLGGGEGKVLGTLLGACTLAVILNGMNLCQVESAAQKVAVGLVLLAAVLLDRARERLRASASA